MGDGDGDGDGIVCERFGTMVVDGDAHGNEDGDGDGGEGGDGDGDGDAAGLMTMLSLVWRLDREFHRLWHRLTQCSGNAWQWSLHPLHECDHLHHH